jgi:hypothetical protein
MTQESPGASTRLGGRINPMASRAQQHGREGYQITGCCL